MTTTTQSVQCRVPTVAAAAPASVAVSASISISERGAFLLRLPAALLSLSPLHWCRRCTALVQCGTITGAHPAVPRPLRRNQAKVAVRVTSLQVSYKPIAGNCLQCTAAGAQVPSPPQSTSAQWNRLPFWRELIRITLDTYIVVRCIKLRPAGEGLNKPPYCFSRTARKRRRAAPLGFHLPYPPSFWQLLWKFWSWAMKGQVTRSGQVARLYTLRKVYNRATATVFEGWLWKFLNMIGSSVPTKCISRIFDICNLKSGNFCNLPIMLMDKN